jgi:cephalosporin hydroxylase
MKKVVDTSKVSKVTAPADLDRHCLRLWALGCTIEPPMRDFSTFFHTGQLGAFQAGVLGYRYRHLACLKSPLDIAIYMRLLWDARPRTIFEIGSREGGSALLFRDLMRLFETDCRIVSIDLEPPNVEIEGVHFLSGDAFALGDTFAAHDLQASPRPWLAIDDSVHSFESCTAVLKFFSETLRPAEYLVMEDGVLDDLGLSARYRGGPNAALTAFFRDQPAVFEVVTSYCDMFGRNATYNPNGYLRKL